MTTAITSRQIHVTTAAAGALQCEKYGTLFCRFSACVDNFPSCSLDIYHMTLIDYEIESGNGDSKKGSCSSLKFTSKKG